MEHDEIETVKADLSATINTMPAPHALETAIELREWIGDLLGKCYNRVNVVILEGQKTQRELEAIKEKANQVR